MPTVLPAISPALIASDAAALGVLVCLVALAALLAGPIAQAVLEGRAHRTGSAAALGSPPANGGRHRAEARRAA